MDNHIDALTVIASGFYREPSCDLAVQALVHAFNSKVFDENPDLLISFLKIADHHPEFKEQLRQLREDLVDKRSRLVVDAIIDPPDTLKPSLVLPERVSRPQDLDSYWGSFLATGDVSFVEPIVGVLDWPDLTKSLLNESIANPSFAPIQLTDPHWQELVELGIPIVDADGAMPSVAGFGDVDIILSRAVQSQSDVAKSIFQQLTQEQAIYMATKSAALWSLISNSNQHEIVRA